MTTETKDREMITDFEKHRRAKVLDISRRQADADRAKLVRDGMPAVTQRDATPDPHNPNQPANGEEKSNG